MSIWSTDLGYDETWPEWFLEYRRARDTELHERIDARLRGELTEEGFREWALESAKRHARWVESLPPDWRTWLDAQERADRHVVVPPGTAPAYIPNLFSKPDR